MIVSSASIPPRDSMTPSLRFHPHLDADARCPPDTLPTDTLPTRRCLHAAACALPAVSPHLILPHHPKLLTKVGRRPALQPAAAAAAAAAAADSLAPKASKALRAAVRAGDRPAVRRLLQVCPVFLPAPILPDIWAQAPRYLPRIPRPPRWKLPGICPILADILAIFHPPRSDSPISGHTLPARNSSTRSSTFHPPSDSPEIGPIFHPPPSHSPISERQLPARDF